MNKPEVATLDDQRAACGGQGELLHGRYMVMQNLQRRGEVKELFVSIYLLTYVERKNTYELFMQGAVFHVLCIEYEL